MKNTALASLIREKGYTQDDVAKALGVTRQTVSYWSRTGNLTAKTASALSSLLQVPLGDLLGTEDEEDERIVKVIGDAPVKPGYVRINILSATGCCGDGCEGSSDLVVGALDMAAWFLHTLQGVTSVQRLQIISSKGDSMSPTIEPRALVLVDTNQSRITADGIYCLRVGDNLFIKRIMLNIDGTLTLISDNPLYPPKSIGTDSLDQSQIIGRVVYTFNGKNI